MSTAIAKLQRLAIGNQDELLKRFLMISVAGHMLFFIIDKIPWFQRAPLVAEEMEIAADLVTDLTVSAPDKTTLPDAVEKDEAAARANMLPQLTKQFVVPEAEKKEDEDGEESADNKPKEDAKVADPKEMQVKTRQDADEANKMKMQDALKRLALEQLRKQNEAQTNQAEKKDALARIKDDLAKDNKINSGVVGSGIGTTANRYKAMLQQAVRRHYALPEAYNLKDANLLVIVSIVLNERGNVTKQDIYQSSGDKVFDELAFKAVQNAAPFPPPPPDQAGQEILLQFSPKSM